MPSKWTIKQIEKIKDANTNTLLQKDHVIGVAVGMAKVRNQPTNELCIVVLVDQKLPEEVLQTADIVPKNLDGVRVDVQEIGIIQAQV